MTTNEHSTILLDRGTSRVAKFSKLQPTIFRSAAAIRHCDISAGKDSMWISYSRELTGILVKHALIGNAKIGTGILAHHVDMKEIPLLSSMFRHFVFDVDDGFISAEELAEVLSAENRGDLLIGGFVNDATETVTLWRGNLRSLTVPFSIFQPSGGGLKPDFRKFSIIDCGNTIKLGEYEAATDAILYECDPVFRRELMKKRSVSDRSPGASLRRLRKQKGLRREDFEPDISAKTVARIEQGRVSRIQQSTRETLAKRLGVAPDEIDSF